MNAIGPKRADHPDVSCVGGPATHSGAKYLVASPSECYNLPLSADLVVEVDICQVDTKGRQPNARKLKES